MPREFKRLCEECGTAFVTDQITKILCSRKCNDAKQNRKHKLMRMKQKEEATVEKQCAVCSRRFSTANNNIVTCSAECSAVRRKQMKNAAQKMLNLRKPSGVSGIPARSHIYSDDMVGKTIVRTPTRGSFIGLPVVVLTYEQRMIGDKPTTIQHSASGWIGSINGDVATIIGPRVEFSIPISDIQRI